MSRKVGDTVQIKTLMEIESIPGVIDVFDGFKLSDGFLNYRMKLFCGRSGIIVSTITLSNGPKYCLDLNPDHYFSDSMLLYETIRTSMEFDAGML